jgi:hypothetical protein
MWKADGVFSSQMQRGSVDSDGNTGSYLKNPVPRLSSYSN